MARLARRLFTWWPAAAVTVALAGCVSPQQGKAPPRTPQEVHTQLVRLIPASVPDRGGWATDIQSAFQLLDIPPSTENLCAVLAVAEQESAYTVDPVVPGLAKIARTEIDRRAAQRNIPRFVVAAALTLKSPDGRSYGERLARVRTEQALSGLYEDIIAKLPMGRRLLQDDNPVRTGGPMQVSIAFAEQHARRRPYPYAGDDSIRHQVFTRRGGLYFGIAHLLGYPNAYERHLYRYADFNAGWYASRNAAFQAAVTAASGIPLALDGDLVRGDGKVGATEAAVLSLGPQLGMGAPAIRRQLAQGGDYAFERTDLYRDVFAIAERNAGSGLPRAVMPRIDLHSPKLTRKLTTEWFATRVQERYQRCINRAYAR